MRLGDTKFFNLLALVASSTNPSRAESWQSDGVAWTRERTNHRGPLYSYQLELHTLQHKGRRPWTLLTVHETWWDQKSGDAFRDGRWVRLSQGARQDVLNWFAARERGFEKD
ncbi:MAG TPA: hypothetical protein VN723_13575 [Rhizomicrobium sp.]|jgi:hypothetical protein|nr:hypothetical protein [Rhizomicrobium sp.]